MATFGDFVTGLRKGLGTMLESMGTGGRSVLMQEQEKAQQAAQTYGMLAQDTQSMTPFPDYSPTLGISPDLYNNLATEHSAYMQRVNADRATISKLHEAGVLSPQESVAMSAQVGSPHLSVLLSQLEQRHAAITGQQLKNLGNLQGRELTGQFGLQKAKVGATGRENSANTRAQSAQKIEHEKEQFRLDHPELFGKTGGAKGTTNPFSFAKTATSALDSLTKMSKVPLGNFYSTDLSAEVSNRNQALIAAGMPMQKTLSQMSFQVPTVGPSGWVEGGDRGYKLAKGLSGAIDTAVQSQWLGQSDSSGKPFVTKNGKIANAHLRKARTMVTNLIAAGRPDVAIKYATDQRLISAEAAHALLTQSGMINQGGGENAAP